MPAEISQFLIQHGMLLIAALTIIACVVAVQWRKVRQSVSESEYKTNALAKETSPAEIEWLPPIQTDTRKGLLEQFGALPDGTKVSLTVFSMLAFLSFLTLVFYDAAKTTPERRRSVLIIPELTSERPAFPLEESEAGICRLLYVNDGYVGHDFEVVAVVGDQTSPDSQLAVKVTPGPRPMAYDAASQRVYSYDMNIQALRGTGVFTIEVIAVDRHGVQAKVSFVVQVGDLLPEAAASDLPETSDAGSADLPPGEIGEDDSEESGEPFDYGDNKREEAEIFSARLATRSIVAEVDGFPRAATTGSPETRPIESSELPGEEFEERDTEEPIELEQVEVDPIVWTLFGVN